MSAFQILRELCPTVSVGVLAANTMSLGDDLAALDGAAVGILHFDVMDGCFCPAMTFGAGFVKGIKTNLLKDVHLMIENPLPKLGNYVSAGADILTVHVESCPAHIHRVFQEIGKMTNANDPQRGIVRGVAIDPGTPLEAIEPLLDDIEMVTILAINPGWGGQKFIPATAGRLAAARKLMSGRDMLLCVDGGITRDNIADIAKMDVDIAVTGSAVFDGKNPAGNARFMLDSLKERKSSALLSS